MCGRFSLRVDATTLATQFALLESPAWTLHSNIAPTQEVLVVVQDPATAKRQARRHGWGLIPSWAKDLRIGSQLINAQAETAATKPGFRVAFRKRRCLSLAEGFYEWKPQGRHKQPYCIRLRDGDAIRVNHPGIKTGMRGYWCRSEDLDAVDRALSVTAWEACGKKNLVDYVTTWHTRCQNAKRAGAIR